MENKKYVVVDLEMCKARGCDKKDGIRLNQEIIEIGAVLIEDMKIVDSFKTYVKPVYGKLDDFISRLTGIKSCNIENAPIFEAALESFAKWVPEDATMVAWSENDDLQLKKEMAYKEIYMPEFEKHFDNWEDCQLEFSDRMDKENVYRLSEALIIADIDFDENIHDALVDAQNTALLFIKMRTEEKLKLSPYYATKESEEDSSFRPFAMLFNNLVVNG